MSLLMVGIGGLLFLLGLGGTLLGLGIAATIVASLGTLLFVLGGWRAARPEDGYPVEPYDPAAYYGGIRGSSPD